MRELTVNFMKEHPTISVTALAGLFIGIGIMGLTSSFWAGLLAVGVIMLFITLGYIMVTY